ncbi:hypothetical protein AB0G06_19060 [Nonomuraea dietziae]|uniref:hypothetical protein n=1 Tax=Nonomuraea dietziae TaxID=65515 RepID=UPI0033C4CA97
MAVPPIERSQAVGLAGPLTGTRHSWLLDLILGLLIVAALPLAILAIPNTVSLVAGLLPADMDKLGLIRAHGLALPAMMLTVPLAAVLVQRMKAAPILLVGLAVLAAADAAGGFAGSALVVGVLRVVHGVGAGLLIPALLMAAWERAPLLRALWTGMLAVSLLAAQALALLPLDNARDWRVTLQPYPLLTGVALALAAIYLALSVATGAMSTPGPRAIERSKLTLTAVPAAGLAVLAIGTTFGWPPPLIILAALFSIAALLTLASIGTFEGPAGRTLSYAMLAVGVVVLPTAAQVTYMELGGVGGPGLKGLWLPFLVCAVAGAAAALVVGLLDRASMQKLSGAGLVTVVLGLCAVRVMVPASEGLTLIVPFALLAVGAAVALTAALRMTGPGAALYGLSLCFPGVLAGYLLGTGVQMVLLGRLTSPQQLVDRFVGALHLWVLIGGFLVVAVIMLAALLGRRTAVRSSGAPDPAGGTVSETPEEPVPPAVASDVLVMSGQTEAAGRRPYDTLPTVDETGADQRNDVEQTGAAGSGGRADEAGGPVYPRSGGPGDGSVGDEEKDAPTGEIPRVPAARVRPSAGASHSSAASRDHASDGTTSAEGSFRDAAPRDGVPDGAPRAPHDSASPDASWAGRGSTDGSPAGRGSADGSSTGRGSTDGSFAGRGSTDGSSADGGSSGGDESERPGEGTGSAPVVPPPTQSPEDSEPD